MMNELLNMSNGLSLNYTFFSFFQTLAVMLAQKSVMTAWAAQLHQERIQLSPVSRSVMLNAGIYNLLLTQSIDHIF